MAGLTRIRWDQPKLTILPQNEGHLRRRQTFAWQDVLSLLAQQEMAVRRLHAALHDGALGAIRVSLELANGAVRVQSASSDPPLDAIRDDVVALIRGAGFPTNLVPVRVEIACHFEVPGGAQDTWSEEGWGEDTWGESSGEGGGGRGGSSFGDPF